ncbi:hypothetical protein CTI12_AA625990 [Artemisia annua]|uniref:Uncharacterized protein n=1 Tax=Artemisia annua TaxID=35608 RepID=A0A2U1KAP2_ARTAN|nr:hypothetical protein CTI12_AA625990 [Artemisia annua]
MPLKNEGPMRLITLHTLKSSPTGYDRIVSNIGKPRANGSLVDVYEEQGARIGFYTNLVYLENQADTCERKATSWKMREFNYVNFPANHQSNMQCIVLCETPAYKNALKLYNKGVSALDEAHKKPESKDEDRPQLQVDVASTFTLVVWMKELVTPMQ